MTMPSSAEEPAPLSLDRYVTRDALTYYLLALPALVSAAVFSLDIARTPGALVTQTGPYAFIASAAGQVLPFAVLGASAFAVFSFRPSVLVTLLIGTFFVAVSISDGISVLGAKLDLGDTVILVVAATFLALAGFSYARGIKLLGGRHPDVVASGPAGYNALGLAIECAVPLGAALALVLLVETVVSALGVQAAILPQPLSTLATLYLQTRIGLVFTTLFVAGAAIWVIRQFVEPVILHFTLSASDAKRELLFEIQPTTKSMGKIMRYKPSRGLSWGVLGVAYCSGIFVALVLFLPRADTAHDLLAVFDLHPPAPSPWELLLQDALQNGIVKVDLLFAQFEAYLRDLARLLWG